MITALWHLIWLMDSQIKGKGGTPPAWFTFGTLFIDAFSIACMLSIFEL